MHGVVLRSRLPTLNWLLDCFLTPKPRVVALVLCARMGNSKSIRYWYPQLHHLNEAKLRRIEKKSNINLASTDQLTANNKLPWLLGSTLMKCHKKQFSSVHCKQQPFPYLPEIVTHSHSGLILYIRRLIKIVKLKVAHINCMGSRRSNKKAF